MVIIVGVLALSSSGLFHIFDDLGWGEVSGAIGELSDAEWLSVVLSWLVWVVLEGALTASLVEKLAVRRGVQMSASSAGRAWCTDAIVGTQSRGHAGRNLPWQSTSAHLGARSGDRK